MTDKWDAEAIEAAGRAVADDDQEDYMESWVRYDRIAKLAVSAFLTTLLGPTGEADLRALAAGEMVRSMTDPRLEEIKASGSPVLMLYPPVAHPALKAGWLIDHWHRLPGGRWVWTRQTSRRVPAVGWLPMPAIPDSVASLPGKDMRPLGARGSPEALADAEAATPAADGA